jgi:hypothetical protein
MSLYDMDTDQEIASFDQLWRRRSHRIEFLRVWQSIPAGERDAIEREINGRLDDLVAHPDARWGSITNSSIEGSKESPVTGMTGDWTGTPFAPIYDACGCNVDLAGMFFGNVWKMVIANRPEHWIGVHSDLTFPNRGITLEGKTYFLDRR